MIKRNSLVPPLEAWKLLSELERAQLMSTWDTYGGEGEQLVKHIAAEFEEEYGKIPGINVGNPGIYHGGSWVIDVARPFIFDRRRLPNMYLGIPIHISLSGELPSEFKDGIRRYAYVWAPPHYEDFVDRNLQDIREKLCNLDMSREEVLSALVGMPFPEWVKICREWAEAGRIENFE